MPPTVEFDQGTTGSYRPSMSTSEQSAMARLLQKVGVPAEQVNKVLVIVSVVLLGLAIVIFLSNGSDTSYRSKKLSPEQQRKLLEIMPPDRSPVPSAAQ